MNKKIKIALIDDEHLFLEGLALLFTNNENISVVLTSSKGDIFLEEINKLSP